MIDISTKKLLIAIGKTCLVFVFFSFSTLSLLCLDHLKTAHAHPSDSAIAYEHLEIVPSVVVNCVEAPTILTTDRREDLHQIYSAILPSSVFEVYRPRFISANSSQYNPLEMSYRTIPLTFRC